MADKQSVRNFTKQAKSAKATNLLVSSVEGIGLGLVGAGIPDIPLFAAVVLKSVYEVALSYGYDYQTDEEKVFILKVIEVAMYDEEKFVQENDEFNALIDQIVADGDTIDGYDVDKEAQINLTAKALSHEMLYSTLPSYMSLPEAKAFALVLKVCPFFLKNILKLSIIKKC